VLRDGERSATTATQVRGSARNGRIAFIAGERVFVKDARV